jgi:hypothetical protein
MRPPTAHDFLRFASSIEGERLTTAARGAAFTIRTLPRGIEITPESSGMSRVVNHERIDLFLQEYERSRSVRPGHYQDITFDASYLLAITARFVARRGESEGHYEL